MAEDNTLQGVIERIRAEGQLTRNKGTNSVKVTNDILKTISVNIEGMYNVMQTNLALMKEKLGDQGDDDLLRPKNTPAPAGNDTPAPTQQGPDIAGDTKNTLAIFGGLGIIGKGIALALGGALGVIQGQLIAIKAVAKTLTPKAWSAGLNTLKTRVNNRITALRTGLTTSIAGIRASVTTGLANFGEFLKIDPKSNLGKTITGFKSFFTPIGDMIKGASETLKGIVGGEGKGPMSKIKNFLNIMKGYFTTLGATVAGVARVVGRIFAPIAIIVTAFDTVKGAIAGYAEDGILGGLQGAIDGLFTSLITKPLDLLKDAVAWVLGKLGFDNSAEALNSFSFTELWTGMTDKIFDGVKDAIKVVKDLFTFGEEDKTALGLLGKLTDIIYAPINMAINFIRGLFGWNEEGAEPFKLNDYIVEQFNAGITWAKDALSGVSETIRTKFGELSDWITGIPDRVTMEAKVMMTNLKAKLKIGFLMFGEWFASIPDRIKLMALETIRNMKGGVGKLIVGADDVAEARAAVDNRSSDLQERLQKVEDERVAKLAELDKEAAAMTQNNATVTNNGGNTSNATTNNYYSQTGTSHALDPSDPRAFAF